MMVSAATCTKRGFTLLELLLVVLLFSAAAGILYPNISRIYRQTYFENAAREIASVIDYARGRAYQENAFLKLELDFKARSYMLKKKDESQNISGKEEFVLINGRYGKSKKLPTGMQFYSGTSRGVVFNPDGAAEKYQIILRAAHGKQATIKSAGYFGKPEVTFS